MMKAIGYVRVSTEEQARTGISLDMQRAKVQAYADLEDMDLMETIADEGISGCSIKGRPGIEHILELVRSKEIKAVIIYKLDRLARNTIEALQVAKLMDRIVVALHSTTEKLDTKSAMGRFFFTLMASIAEMERGIISERIQAAMERKREKGEPCNNNPPFGYRIVGNRLLPDLTERRVINRILELHSEGRTLWAIQEILKQEGMVNRRGRPFGHTRIHTIITAHKTEGMKHRDHDVRSGIE